MKTITIGRKNCDIIIQDDSISRKHATISLVSGQYVYHDTSKNGSNINGRIYQNEKVVVAPNTPIYLANKVLLPWSQILMLLPISGIITPPSPPIDNAETIGVGWGILSFLFPIIGFILYFIWKDTNPYSAKQAANIAWISIAISFVIGFISGLSM